MGGSDEQRFEDASTDFIFVSCFVSLRSSSRRLVSSCSPSFCSRPVLKYIFLLPSSINGPGEVNVSSNSSSLSSLSRRAVSSTHLSLSPFFSRFRSTASTHTHNPLTAPTPTSGILSQPSTTQSTRLRTLRAALDSRSPGRSVQRLGTESEL